MLTESWLGLIKYRNSIQSETKTRLRPFKSSRETKTSLPSCNTTSFHPSVPHFIQIRSNRDKSFCVCSFLSWASVALLPHHRQVIVWGDYGRLDHKCFMGVAQILLEDLDLSSTVIGWYKLFPPSSLVDPTLAPLTRLASQTSLDSSGPPPGVRS